MGRNALLLRTTKRRITTNSKTKNSENSQEIKLYGTLTTKELKKHSSRLVRGVEMGIQAGGEDAAKQWTTWVRWGLANQLVPHLHPDNPGGPMGARQTETQGFSMGN